MGVSVSARAFKRAVDRNLVKRRIREAYRLQNNTLKLHVRESAYNLDVFLVYSDHKMAEYETIAVSVEKLLDKLNQYFTAYIAEQGDGYER